jgi:lipopolysaccharide/colanic/teichoic acid biosynthesis glycosyltransferase
MDELPQLINVFKGEMSIVGPRPPIPSEVGKYDNWQRRRLSMKPGLTCLWQVTPCRNDVCFEEWMNLDLQYIDTCPLVPLAASPSPSAIGCASGECRVGLAGGRACNGRRDWSLGLDFKILLKTPWSVLTGEGR